MRSRAKPLIERLVGIADKVEAVPAES